MKKKNLYKSKCISVLIVLFVVLFYGVFHEAAYGSGVLRVNPDNPRYFTDDNGKAIYLSGSHTWDNLVIEDLVYPPNEWFDFNSYLEFLENHNHNFIRMWANELFRTTRRYANPSIWKRTGPGNALDAHLKFDLTKLNQEYFDRLLERVSAANARGIYVSIMLFEGYGPQFYDTPWCWDGHPFNIHNNINGINGNPDGNSRGLEIYTMAVSSVNIIQKAYVRKVIDTINSLDNVLYEVGNEITPISTEWQYDMINYIKNYESTKPKQHPVGMTFQHIGGSNAALFNSPADWVSPMDLSGSGDDYKTNPPLATGNKVVILDTDHLWGIGGTQEWVWKSFTRGYNTIYMDPWGDYGNPFDAPGDEVIRRSMGYVMGYAEKIQLANMTPRNTSSYCSTTYCLVNAGKEYLIYQPNSGSFSVNLNAGTYYYEWFNPDTGQIKNTGNLTTATGAKNFTPPFSGDSVLYLKNSNYVTFPTTPSGLMIK